MPRVRHGKRTLSKVQQRVVELVAEGCKNREIASQLGTTEQVVKNYLRIIFDRVGAFSRLELALWHEAHRKPAP